MKELEFFRRQFLLSEYENFKLPWNREKILNYNLFYHPDLEFEHVANEMIDLYLLGFLFDYENPEYSNKKILDSLKGSYSFEHFLENLTKYSGHYVIIYRSTEKFILLNDACAQHEVYYDNLFSSFATQIKLLEKVIPIVPHSSVDAINFFSSPSFISQKIFIGETTHAENIKHLLPNHYIDIEQKSIIRFFPKDQLKSNTINEASMEACKMLKGYIKAASLRNKIYMAVTGGYDSRVLFLASLDVDCKYYVSRLNNMDSRHNDIVIPQKLAKIFNKEFKVIVENPMDKKEKLKQEISIDFPRELKIPGEEYYKHILINGNISEIARNYYGYYQNILPGELAILYGHNGNSFVCKEYEKWLKRSSSMFSEKGYNILDMFYWEEKMGNWAAKAKTEMSAMGTIIYSPFCSHKLLTILLSTPRNHRDEYSNNLYDMIINNFSNEVSKIPINPSTKKKIILILKRFKIFNLIQIIKLKFKLLKI
jgi:hypothetical protein